MDRNLLLPVHLGPWLVSSQFKASITFYASVYWISFLWSSIFVVVGNFARGSRKRNFQASPVLRLEYEIVNNLLKHFHAWIVTLLFHQGSEKYIWTHSIYSFGCNLSMFWKLCTVTFRCKNVFFCSVCATIFKNQRCSCYQLCKQQSYELFPLWEPLAPHEVIFCGACLLLLLLSSFEDSLTVI